MRNRVKSSRVLMLSVGLLLAAPAFADPPAWARRGAAGFAGQGTLLADNRVNLDGAVSRIRRQTGSRVLSADTVRGDGRTVHEIKVLTDQGRVKRWRVDGDTGEVIRPRRRR